jgi:hypothetical protein
LKEKARFSLEKDADQIGLQIMPGMMASRKPAHRHFEAMANADKPEALN